MKQYYILNKLDLFSPKIMTWFDTRPEQNMFT